MKIRRISSIFAAILAMASFSAVHGWDDVGHKITGYIAWKRMTPEARERVIKILRAAPEDSHLSAFYFAYGPRTEAEKRLDFFMLVPTWADIVRDRAVPIRYEKYHRSTWHYSDTFWRKVDGNVEIITDKEPGGQGVVKLNEFDKIMRDTSAGDAEKAIAIAWFLHVAGDLHQPLHTSGRHTELEPNGDQGGNLFLLTPEGTPRNEQVNLHWFWDSIVGRNVPYREGMSEFHYIKDIAESILTRYPYDNRSSLMLLGSYDKWQFESFSLATTDVFNEELKRFVMPGDRYLRNAYRVSEERLAMAGYRMADTMNEIFGK